MITWCFVGHSFPIGFLFSNAIVFPVILTVLYLYNRNNIIKSKFTIISFGLLLFFDLYIRLFGGGDYDQLGKVFCNLSFYSTFATTSIALIFFNYYGKEDSIKWKRFLCVALVALLLNQTYILII